MPGPEPAPPGRPAGAPRRGGWLSLVIVLATVTGLSQGGAWWRERGIAETARSLARPGDIEMFTTLTCPYCARARHWLDRHDVPWTECNVDTSDTCRARFEAQGAPGVPLLHVRGQWRLGFDASWLSHTLTEVGRAPTARTPTEGVSPGRDGPASPFRREPPPVPHR